MMGTHTLLVLKVAYVAIVIFDVRVTMLLPMRDDISALPRESAMVAVRMPIIAWPFEKKEG